MFDCQKLSKIKNEKIQRWRLELVTFKYEIIYSAGRYNVPADTLTRVTCSAASILSQIVSCSATDNLSEIHKKLCHPGVVRFHHFIRARNLPFSLDEVKQIFSECQSCCKLKPKFYKPLRATLIKATQPRERLSIDFKGPLPSASHNHYILSC